MTSSCRGEQDIVSLIHTTKIYSNNIGMFTLEKCGWMAKKAKAVRAEGIALPEDNIAAKILIASRPQVEDPS